MIQPSLPGARQSPPPPPTAPHAADAAVRATASATGRAPLARTVARVAALLALLPALAATETAGAQLPKVKLPERGGVVRGLGGGDPLRQPVTRPAPAGSASTRENDVPRDHRPPPGMCRVWLDGVPAGQQPAITDCATAVRNRPANGRVLFGDDYAEERGKKGGATVPGIGPGTSGVSAPAGTAPAGGAPAARPPRDAADLPGASAALPTPGEAAGAYAVGTPESWRPVAFGVERAHGPAADDAAPGLLDEAAGTLAVVPVDTTARPVPPAGARPAPAPIRRPARPAPTDRRRGDVDDGPADDWEDGYAAGYEDAVRGRAPRVAGVRTGRGRGAADARDVDDRYADGRYVDGRAYPGSPTGSAAASGGVYGGGVVAAPGQGAVVVVPPSNDPRYFNNGQYPPPGRANGTCLDRDGDGWCDDPRYGAPVCRDVDGDGRCDDVPDLAAAAYPSSLPGMRSALDWQQGRGSPIALRWLGTPEVLVRLGDTRGSGLPTRALWYDANTNALLQIWTDLDGDGVANRVEVFRNGRRVKLFGR